MNCSYIVIKEPVWPVDLLGGGSGLFPFGAPPSDPKCTRPSGDGMAPGREGVVPWESGMSAERGPCHTPRSAQLGGAEDERDGQELS